MKTIICDIDGVLADFIKGFTELAYKSFNSGIIPFTTCDLKSKDFDEDFPSIPLADTWDHIIKYPEEFWNSLNTLATELELSKLQRLHSDNIVYFVTQRPNYATWSARDWLYKHIAPLIPNVIVIPEKSQTAYKKGEIARAVSADYAIEDNVSNATALSLECRKVFFIDKPYNQCDFLPHNVERVKTLGEALDQIQEAK